VKEPKRIPIPLSVDQVAQFWSGFRNTRDLAIVGLMLLQGLRSKEVIALDREDVQLAQSRICVHGKGNKIRLLPLASETIHLLDHYPRLERPTACGPALFVSLKGRSRGIRITPAGLRSLFRYHRRTSGIAGAHPHRFRHTFASDMVRAGISLPALMQLMGHAHISTTMIYVQISPRAVVVLLYGRKDGSIKVGRRNWSGGIVGRGWAGRRRRHRTQGLVRGKFQVDIKRCSEPGLIDDSPAQDIRKNRNQFRHA
jgi:integrase/recombinase XerD